jgi:serine phosphatase RsbU (regulator of sigma subunit)
VLAITLYNRNVIKQRANLKLQEAYAIIQEKNSDIMASIEYASKIQEALLPSADNPDFFSDSFFMVRPKDIVSGDFLWYTELDGKKIVAVVDCTGHGVPGAFMSMIGNTFLQQIINERGIMDPAEVLNELRKNVVRALNQKGKGVNRKDGMDMAICVIDEANGMLEFAGANNPLFVMQSKKMLEIKGDKQPVGYFEGNEMPFTKHTIQIEKGDCIYIFSDGYVDQFGGPKGKKFKYRQFSELLQSLSRRSMQEQKEIINQVFDEWKGELEQVDDVCVVGIRMT